MMEKGNIRGLPGALVEKPREGICKSYQIEDRPHINEVAHPDVLLQYKSISNGAVPLYIVTDF